MKDASFKGVGGLNLYGSSWHPEGKSPRAVVVIAHGFNSHSGYYGWAAEQLVAAGYAVYALDHRGRGKSDGERYWIDKASDYVDDLATFIELAKSREPGKKVFLLGHSAGGVISCTYCLDHQAKIDGLICESFAFKVYAPDFALAVLKGLSHVAPHAHVLKLPIQDFSRDPQVVEAMNNDPQVMHEVQPTRTVAELARADDRLEREFSQIRLPVLILHGTADKVTKPEGSQFFYDQAGSKDKTLKLYDGYVHDLLSDLGKEVPMADIVRWLNERA
jgi:alpha-beta hydrolase superfamily lysophospholipase